MTLYAWQVMLAASGLMCLCAVLLGDARRAALAGILFAGIVLMRLHDPAPEWGYGLALWAMLAALARRWSQPVGLMLLASACCYPLELVAGWGWSAQVASNGAWWGAFLITGAHNGLLAASGPGRGSGAADTGSRPGVVGGAVALATGRRAYSRRPVAED